MDIVNKAIAKATDLANKTTWNDKRRIKINTEEKRIEDLRNKTLAKRAEIGEEMFRLWQAHKLPPSQLDGLFYELQDLIDATGSAAQNLDALKAETYEQATSAHAQTASSYAAAIAPLPAAPLPPGTAPPALGAGPSNPAVLDVTPAMTLVECATCHSMVRADRNFCGRCGPKLR